MIGRNSTLNRIALICAAALCVFSGNLIAQVPGSAYRVSTYAGADPLGDGGPAVDGLLYNPTDLAVDSNGRIFIADNYNNRIRLIDTGGTISTYAGSLSGLLATAGGRDAQSAYLRGPTGIAVDSDGNVYFSEPSEHIISKITPEGIVSIFAGKRGGRGFSGDGGPASDAQFNYPWGLCFDGAGNLYVADKDNNRIRRITPAGVITTVAGVDTGGFSGDGGLATAAELNAPYGVAADSDGVLYIADSGNYRVRRVGLDGMVSTVVGTGFSASNKFEDGDTAAGSTVKRPDSVHVATNGDLYIGGSGYIARIDGNGKIFGVIGNLAPPTNGPLAGNSVGWPTGITQDPEGRILFVDQTFHKAARIEAGTVTVLTGASHFSGDGGPATQAHLFNPGGTAIDSDGNLYIADYQNYVVRRVSPAGIITTVAGTPGEYGSPVDGQPATEAKLYGVVDVAVDAEDNLYILDNIRRHVYRVSAADGTISNYAGSGDSGDAGDGGPATEASFRVPGAITVDANGNLYVSDANTYRVRKISPDGTITAFAGTGTGGYSGSDSGDGGPAVDVELGTVGDVSVDAFGNVIISGFGANNVRSVSPAGIITTIASLNGNVTSAVVEQNGSILMTNPNSSYVAVAKRGGLGKSFSLTKGFAGDGGPANQARFGLPEKMTVAPDGRVFVSDKINARIRVLTPIPVLFGGSNAAGYASGGAPASIVAVFGWNLSDGIGFNTGLPLPVNLAGASAKLTDTSGDHDLQTFYTQPTQRNMYIPDGVNNGDNLLTITNEFGESGSVVLPTSSLLPGIFTLNSTGAGVAAATVQFIPASGDRSYPPAAQYDSGSAMWVPAPINLGSDSDLVYITLYATGVRGRSDLSNVTATINGVSVPVVYAGETGGFVGLDQIDIGPVPRSLVGAGEVEVQVIIDGVVANTVTLAFQ